MVLLLAADLIGKITNSSVSGVQEDSGSEIDGLQELKIQLYDRDTSICLETSNLALDNSCTIILKESSGGVNGKQQEPRLTISSFKLARSSTKGL